jgi:hypothetical protein
MNSQRQQTSFVLFLFVTRRIVCILSTAGLGIY